MTHTNGASRTLSVGSLARVEGEGSMHVVVRDGVVSDVELRIFEPPRFFEAFLRGRAAAEVPDIAARICGICPVAYQMSACQAIESACGIAVDDQVRALRRLLYCGEWIESHTLHIYLLHAPDFLGYESSVALAQDHRAIVERGLQLKKVGNDILNVLGGRAIHPVNVRVGGFYKAPSFAELDALTERLRWAVDAAIETVQWVAGFDFPDLQLEGDLVAMQHAHEYPITEGRIASTSGLDIPVDDFPEYFSEEQVAHSTALHGRMRGGGTYTVGPLARYNLNYDRLPALVQELAVAAGVARECRNPFQSIIVRALEVVFACDEALRIIAAYTPPAAPSAEMPARGGTGHGCTEAPRGLLYHRYTVDDAGVIRDAVIVPPTSQNQPSIERGLREFVQVRLDLDDAELTRQCEQAIRNYDPCISCATHFLDLTVDRG
ncbi:MAG TPA: Ni/Fe hydrogenase subunit alpha [Candidatus Saccharimonadales bacterium]|nr:Ni/Fe hydrogenase subunit alpha [Candidatus Saccharimonadales bacterium]